MSAALSCSISVRQSTATRLRSKAQDSSFLATLGFESVVSSTPRGLRPFATTTRDGVTQPRWGWNQIALLTQGSSFLATLGFGTESRWDSGNGNHA